MNVLTRCRKNVLVDMRRYEDYSVCYEPTAFKETMLGVNRVKSYKKSFLYSKGQLNVCYMGWQYLEEIPIFNEDMK